MEELKDMISRCGLIDIVGGTESLDTWLHLTNGIKNRPVEPQKIVLYLEKTPEGKYQGELYIPLSNFLYDGHK